ncbi:MAG: hypothetical protein HYR62_02505 [Actinobacteria bacterium]|nr:hypothetical protein [Actinomycetota bacterium]MBI3687347.1 hypothetical protein [Actinomycetota bacterium]
MLAPATAVASPVASPVVAVSAPAELMQVTIDQLEPRSIRPGDTITVVASLANLDTTPVEELTVQLRSGRRLVTRTDLANADTSPPPVGHGAGARTPVPRLVGRHSTRVTYRTTAAALGLTQIGVYPVELTVEGRRGARTTPTTTMGAVRTFLPYFPDGVSRPTRIAWLIPLVDRPHRLTDGEDRTFLDDTLATALAPRGRLADLLLTMQHADAASVPFTVAVDPDLVDSVEAMSHGYTVLTAHGRVPGTGGDAAAAWLRGLRTLVGRHVVVALPFADMDTVALARAGLSQLAETDQTAIDKLNTQLGALVNTRIYWPPDGAVTEDALDSVVRQGAQAIVLSSASLPGRATGGLTRSAASPLPSGGGSAVALVTDASLDGLIGAAGRAPNGPRLAEQRYLAELAMITAESPSVSRTLLLAPDRRWNPDPRSAAPMLTVARTVPWLAAGTVAELTNTSDLVDRGRLVYPPHVTELRGSYLQSLRNVQGLIADFRTSLDNAGAQLLVAPLNHAILRAASSAWRADPVAGDAFLTRVGARIVSLRSKVYIVAPANGRYTLGGQDSVLPLTMVNELEVPVTVRVRLSTRGTVGLTAHDLGPQLLEPATGGAKRTLLRIPVTLTQAGRFQVSAEVLTPGGWRPLNNKPVVLQVQSTAYGAVALGITGAALGLMLLLVARRVYRRVRSGPEFEVHPAGSPAERGR